MQLWIISDTHFFHQKLVECGDRPENFTEKIVENWNKVVKPEDTVLHLGDVIFGMDKQITLPAMMKRLNGTKILTLGNHDTKGIQFYMNNGFAFACKNFQVQDIFFSHAPTTPLPKDIRFNIHGHLHKLKVRGVPGVPDDCYDYKYFDHARENYELIQIDDELRPFTFEEIVARWEAKNSEALSLLEKESK